MIRIAGITLPDHKKIDIALTLIYGVGRNNAVEILKKAQVDSNKRVKEISSEEASKLQTLIESEYKVEGDLRKGITDTIKRLKAIGSYRGLRHARNLPARGQRTRSNARTKRGKRVTIGAMRKETRVKLQSSDTGAGASETK